MDLFALLLLGDGRFPAGGHAHSGGIEAAVLDGRVVDLRTLESFARGRLRTAGLVDAALAAATVRRLEGPAPGAAALEVVAAVDGEASARLSPPPLRAASRRLGRQLVRAGSRCWPAPLLAAVTGAFPGGLHLAVATGSVGLVAGIDAPGVAALVAHHAIATPVQAAVKLLGLDPFEAVALAARLAPLAAEVAAAAVQAGAGDLADLPALTGPLVDLSAMDHERAEARMFAT